LLHAQGGNPPAWVVGDVFVAVGKGQYEVRDKTGSLKQTITSSVTPKKDVAGCWFDSQFNLYTADFYNTKVVKYDLAGSHASSVFADTNAQAPNGHSESIVMAVNGDVYVGHAGDGLLSRQLLRYRSDGAFIASYTPAIESGGTGVDWIDLSVDQKTIYFTSRFRDIRKFDVSTNTTTVLTTLGAGGQAFAIRLLGPSFDGSNGLLVADSENIKQLNAAGGVIATYDYDPNGTNNDENSFRALNLDPDGVHFWAGGFDKGRLYRFTFGSSAPDSGFPINTGAGNSALGGICVMGEPQTQVVPLNLSNPGTSTVLQDLVATFGRPGAINPTDFYSLSTWRLRINVKAGRTVVAAVGFTPQTADLFCPQNGNPLTDFDCRFPQSPAPPPQCVPFFNNPTATSSTGLLQYQCASYRLKDLPACSLSDPLTDPNCPFADPHVPGSTDILGEIILNLTNPPGPPTTVFDASAFGNDAKGSPRLYRDPDSVSGNMFFDSTTGVIDWPALGSGTPNEYTAAMRRPETLGACAQIIGPNGTGMNSQSAQKMTVVVRTGPLVNGVCTGSDITDAATAPNSMTLAVSGTGTNHFLKLYCKIAGNSNECFELNGQTYQANVKVNEIPPDTVNPYIFAVTSTCVASTQAACQVKFPPVSRQYFVCPNGSNCGS
jgi:hypothetical protein